MDLTERLQVCMQQTRLTMGITTQATEELRLALRDDPALVAEAEARIAAGVLAEQRDHFTRWQNSLLRTCLADHDV